jgi:hypothetical protein
MGPAGGGTASNSSPHADSRRMVLDANGDIIEVDDGGIYRRTSPSANTGDWFSVNGTLQVTEIHDIAYDTLSNIIVGATQDNGTNEQQTTGSLTWRTTSGADGGDVAVDNVTLAGSSQSIRYQSYQNLGSFRRRVYNASNVLVSETFPALTVVGGGAALVPQFRTPFELNKIDPTRLVIVGDNSIYESLDQGSTITEIGTGQGPNGATALQNAVAYGGKNGGNNEDVLYVGINAQVLVRTAAYPSPLTASATYPGQTVRDIVLDPNNWMNAFVTDDDQVFSTTNAGGSWTDITGNLGTIGAREFRTVEYIPAIPNDLLVLGTNAQVFVAFSNDFTFWDQLGTGLPNALVFDLAYDAAGDVLVAGTLGRGAWLLANASGVVPGPTGTPTSTPMATSTPTPLPPPAACGPTPLGGCDGAGKAGVLVTNEELIWKWLKGTATTQSDFGDPFTGITSYTLCIYDDDALEMSATVTPGLNWAPLGGSWRQGLQIQQRHGKHERHHKSAHEGRRRGQVESPGEGQRREPAAGGPTIHSE